MWHQLLDLMGRRRGEGREEEEDEEKEGGEEEEEEEEGRRIKEGKEEIGGDQGRKNW